MGGVGWEVGFEWLKNDISWRRRFISTKLNYSTETAYLSYIVTHFVMCFLFDLGTIELVP